MALLGSTSTHPPDSWKFLNRETETWIRGEIWQELVDLVIVHRQYKGVGSTNRAEVELEIQRQICAGAFPGVCNAEPGEDYKPFKDLARSLNLAAIESASASLIKWLKEGMRMVSKEESADRAKICRGCPYNKPAAACVCTTLFAAIEAMLPGDRKEPGLVICTLCGCSLRIKTLAPMSVVREGNPPDLRLPEWCWQK